MLTPARRSGPVGKLPALIVTRQAADLVGRPPRPPDPNPDGTLVDDVVIGDWRRPWNLRSERPLGGIPSSSLWATDPAGFGQVGCIYTAQGFEYDFAGVIIGPDLVWRGDRWRTNPTATADTQVRRAANFDLLVRNVYKVLLTRGLIGCVIYSTDPETRALLTKLGTPGA